MANTLNLSVIPEGIETKEQLYFFKELLGLASTSHLEVSKEGARLQNNTSIFNSNLCTKAQGFYLAPCSCKRFKVLLKSKKYNI